jgi:hypothetical protein
MDAIAALYTLSDDNAKLRLKNGMVVKALAAGFSFESRDGLGTIIRFKCDKLTVRGSIFEAEMYTNDKLVGDVDFSGAVRVE